MLGLTVGGRYQIISQLGQGGFGTTFLAQDIQRPGNPQCVVKQFKPLAQDEYTLKEAKRLFDLEAAILETLGNHHQIPQLLAHIEENQKFFLVQEFIPGHDLNQEIPPITNQLNEGEVIKLLKEILEVLVFVQQNNVIHRDIKPANIRRRKIDSKIVLIDFGAVKQISTQMANSQGQSSFTVAIGTPGYMPSEQANQVPQFSSDVYAVGIIAIQALTGIDPSAASGLGLSRNSNTGEIEWRKYAQVTSKFADVLDKMVCYDFRQRYPTAKAALEALGALAKTQIIPVQQTWLYFSPKILLFLVGITAALTTVIVIIVSQPKQNQLNWQNYENTSSGIKIKYPPNWEKQDTQNVFTKELVTFILPKQTATDNFQEKLTISVEDSSKTLEEYKNLFIEEIKNTVQDAKIEAVTETKVANTKANQLVFIGKNGENKFKNLQVWTLKNKKLYIITYTAAIDDYQQFLKTAETMIQSLEID